ncbi:MAG: hypothetical protein H7338_00725 [Candidatus Sericytochromatia bacterium]|nr:hypothetical protein [Candidatus Sericytochromatia bacterium]
MSLVDSGRAVRRRPHLTWAAVLALTALGCTPLVPDRRVTVSVVPGTGWVTLAIAPRTLADVDHLEIRLVADMGWPIAPYASAVGTSARMKPQGASAQMVFDQVPPGIYRVAVRAFADGAETRNITRISPDWGGQVAMSAAAVTVAAGQPVRYSVGTYLTVAVAMLDGVGDRLEMGFTFADGSPNPPISVEVLAS